MDRVSATPAAVRTIELLRAKHGDLVLHQSGGCCDGSAAMCLTAAELPPGPNDVRLGTIASSPFVIDRELDARWGHPSFELDVVPGAAESFSLEGAEGVHFISRAPRVTSREEQA